MKSEFYKTYEKIMKEEQIENKRPSREEALEILKEFEHRRTITYEYDEWLDRLGF